MRILRLVYSVIFTRIQIFLKMKSLFLILSLIYSAQSQSCQDFSNGLCPMEEANIISSDLNIWSPDECQALCMYVISFLVHDFIHSILIQK